MTIGRQPYSMRQMESDLQAVAGIAGVVLCALLLVAIILIPSILGRIHNEIAAARLEHSKLLSAIKAHLSELEYLAKANHEREEERNASETTRPSPARGAYPPADIGAGEAG